VPRELVVFGVQLPMLLPLFLLGIVLQVTGDWLLGALGFYRWVWHPSLVRLCLFACILGGLILHLYK
jgi:uncharacterized membrane protein YeaQ/YmgE (transglycosylase-associated protein family)